MNLTNPISMFSNQLRQRFFERRQSTIARRRPKARQNSSSQSALALEWLEPRCMLDGAGIAGTLDLSFDLDGFAIAAGNSDHEYSAGTAIAVQTDGKIIAGGYSRPDGILDWNAVIARFNSDGTLDAGFGNNGVYIDSSYFRQTWELTLSDIAVDQQGRILWSGGDGAIHRVNANGTADISFGNVGGGSFVPGVDQLREGNKILPQADGGIVVAGRGYNTQDYWTGGSDVFIYKLTENGLADGSFGGPGFGSTINPGAFINGGLTAVDFGSDQANNIGYDENITGAFQTADNKFVLIGGRREVFTGAYQGIAVRFHSNGQLDTSFGSGGQLLLPNWDVGFDGFADTVGRYVISVANHEGTFVVRIDSNGVFDSTFGDGDGISENVFSQGRISKLAEQTDGKIILATGSHNGEGVVARLNADGSHDASFTGILPNFPGRSHIRYPGFPGNAGINDVAIQPDGKIVIVGRNINSDTFSPDYAFIVGRVNGDIQPVPVTGSVYSDANNDGEFQSGSGEAGIEGVTVSLTGADISNNAVNRTMQTLADGSFSFDDVLPGSYSLSSDQPVGFLDGKETAGNFGGTIDNASDNNSIANFVIGTDGTPATEYLFGEIAPAELSGLVWEDFNADGQVDFGEAAIENVQVALTGTDDRGNAVNIASYTDGDGIFMFFNLRPGEYSLNESQPAGFVDAAEVVGTIDGMMAGIVSGNDQFGNLTLDPGSVGINYNFAERPESGGQISSGQTATIGFWQNNNGKALILALNGASTSTQLGDWLAATLPNMYGASAGASNLTGLTNTQVWSFYNGLFRRKQQEARALGLGGPVKTDAQIFATALAVYVTNLSLAGSTATSYGFAVTANGVGTSTINIGTAGQAFDVANNSMVSVMDLLLAVNARSNNGILYDLDHDADANDSLESLLRTLANNVFSSVNERGHI